MTALVVGVFDSLNPLVVLVIGLTPLALHYVLKQFLVGGPK